MILQSQPMTRSLPASVSSTSSEGRIPSSKSRRRGSRTLVACEACKKRKTKCSGRPAQCEACQKLETFCHFNSKLDARRKTAYKPIALHEKKEYIFHGILKALKFNDSKYVNHLVDTLRSNASPQEIAICMKQNLLQLQDKHLIASLDVDENDIVSLALQNLFSHRGKRATFVSRDQTNYLANGNGADSARPQDGKIRPLRRKGDETESQSADQDHQPSLEDMDAISPVTTETSISLCLDDNTPNFNSATTGRHPTLPLFHTSKIDPRKRDFDHDSPTIETNGKHRQFSLGSQPKPNYHTISPHSTVQDYPLDHRNDQISPTDRFYMLFNPSLGGNPDDRVAADHMQRLKSTPKLSTANMPQTEWPPPQWPYETGHPLFRPHMFIHDGAPANMNEGQHLDYHDSLFADTLFHAEQPSHN